MNRSFDGSQNRSAYHLPPLRNESVQFNSSKMHAQSYDQLHRSQKIPITRKLVNTDNLCKIEEYNDMNQKQLLREHQNLLTVLKKYQEIIDINLIKKQKQKQYHKGKSINKEQLMIQQINNNKKIIENNLNQIKDLEIMQKLRSLNQVLVEKTQVQDSIARVKKQMFYLKNQNTMNGSKLINDRGNIQKQVKQHQRDLKVQLSRNSQYKKKIDQLTIQLQQLKKQTQKIEVKGTHVKKQSIFKLQQKKQQLLDNMKMLKHKDQSIQQVMVNKTKRNKLVSKQIENTDEKINQLNVRMQNFKQKISRYQKIIEV